METDEESDDSDSGAEEGTPEAGSPEAAAADPTPPPPQEDEVMDTSPDNPPVTDEPPPVNNPHRPPHTIVVNPTTEESDEVLRSGVLVQVPSTIATPQEAVDALIAADLRVTREDEARLRAAEREIAAIAPGVTPEERASLLRAAERELSTVGHIRRAARTGTGREQLERRERREGREADDEGEGDDDSDDSDSEEENPYWTNFKEDTSTPDERELKLIEDMEEVSALNHDHWEKRVFEPLDDPEYVPDEAVRIEWVVKGVHGTPEKPNREKIMRSPSVKVGEYYWNIKYFPHGNDGTEQLSIYIECSPRPYEEVEKEETEAKDTEKATTSRETSSTSEGPNAVGVTDQNATGNSITSTPVQSSDNVDPLAAHGALEEQMIATPTQTTPTPPKKEKEKEVKVEEPWGIAAQISCVIYNPSEPRVNATQKGCHRFYNDNPDWGWTRFHGPWDEIHKRQRSQRQALLRNDTLNFTAYIRTIKDDTKALWFHPPKDNPEWDSMAMTGVRAFECQHQSSAMNAALSSWLHMSPIVDLVKKTSIPDPVWEAEQRMRPAFEELQDILEEDESSAPPEREIYLSQLMSILNFYGADVDSKMDVVMIWEGLRRVLNFEASGQEKMETNVDLFGDVLLLKQPDPFSEETGPKYNAERLANGFKLMTAAPNSVQGILEKSEQSPSAAFRQWQSYSGQPQQIPQRPSVLQIELPRQSFFKDARKWKKLTNRIEMNEEVSFNGARYSLYGMIVHSGDLESKEYYSVIRPEGPGTRWFKYGSDHSPRKVEILTSNQAVKAHEGSGENADGTAAVAYIALYVLTENLPNVLCTPFKCKTKQKEHVEEAQAPSASEADAPQETKDDELEEMPFYVFNSDQFQGYTGRGMCNPWQAQGNEDNVREFKFPPETTIEEVKKHLTEKNSGDIELWPMNTAAPSARAYPGLLSYESHKGDSIEEMGQHSGGCRFWMTPAEPRPVPETDTSLLEAQARALLSSPDHQEREAILMTALSATEEALNNTSAPESNPATADNDAEMTEAETAPEGESRPPPAQQTEAQAAAHRRMAELQQQLRLHNQARQEQVAEQVEHLARIQSAHNSSIKYTYFLVKVFDPEKSTLQGVASKLVKSETKISGEVKNLLKVESNESWDIYHERGIEIRSKDLVKSNETFESRCGGADGSIFIAQRRPTSAQCVYTPSSSTCHG